MGAATKFLNYRARSEKEVHDKLIADYPEEITQKIISALKSYKYIDDEDFARRFATDSANLNNNGLLKIKFGLLEKGVSEEVIENVLSGLDLAEQENIIKLIEKKTSGSHSLDAKGKRKLFNYLANKGFQYSQISSCFAEYFYDDEF
ncbi:MAG: recombination regulator RecX [Clostridiales bacterium]|jgi:regulatory protein|nr:recombination regulator RecX [Clostridiales bacterium]